MLPQQLEFKRLPTWRQVGLGGLCDCTGTYFLINISTLLLALSFLLVFIVILNYDSTFNLETWQGNFSGVLACEVVRESKFVKQPIDAMSCYAYIFVGVLCAALGAYDSVSWKERDALWKETHLIDGQDRRMSRVIPGGNGRDSMARSSARRSNGRNSMGRNSVATTTTTQTNKTTYSVEHEEITERRKYNEYIMGKKGSPSLAIRQPIWSYLFAVTLFFLGFTGYLFHASLTNLAKRLDEFALWVVIVHLVAYAWTRYMADGVKWKFLCVDCQRYQSNPRRSSLFSSVTFLALAAASDFGLYLYLELLGETDYARAALVLAFVLFCIPMFLHWCSRADKISSAWSLLILALGCLLGGYLLNEYDVEGEAFCIPKSNFQPHALWHCVSAFGVFFVYLFFRSDNFINDVPIDEENSPRLVTKLTQDEGSLAITFSNNPQPVRQTQLQSLGNASQENMAISNDQDAGSTLTASRKKRNATKKKRYSSARKANELNEDAGSQVTITNLSQAKREIAEEGGETNAVVLSVEQMWTCSQCGYTENSLELDATCRRCENERPSLDHMIVIPFSQPNANTRTQTRTVKSPQSMLSMSTARTNRSKKSTNSNSNQNARLRMQQQNIRQSNPRFVRTVNRTSAKSTFSDPRYSVKSGLTQATNASKHSRQSKGQASVTKKPNTNIGIVPTAVPVVVEKTNTTGNNVRLSRREVPLVNPGRVSVKNVSGNVRLSQQRKKPDEEDKEPPI